VIVHARQAHYFHQVIDVKRPSPTSLPRRGRRFALQLPVSYRIVGETEWHSGTTEDISYSGALLRTEECSLPTSPIVVVVSLSSIAAEAGGCLMGGARVVRRIVSPSPTAPLAFAVTFMWYRLGRMTNLTA
jgi:hypothetical protein